MKRNMRFISLIILCLVFAGCSPVVQPDQTMSIYASCYPVFALTDGIMDDIPDSELHCLIQPQDGCLRKYMLSDWDIYMLASSADGIIMGGRGLESFESTLFALEDAGPAVSAVLYNLELYNQDDASGTDEDASHLEGANPHLYMSIEGAKQISESIAASLISYDPDYADQYNDNLANTKMQLNALKEKVLEITGDIEGKKVILMNEALVYVADEYGLEVSEWIDRESGEALYDSDLRECLEILSGFGTEVILIEKQAPQSFVHALRDAGFKVAEIDILSTHMENEGFEGYIQAQISNAEAIKAAFAG